MPIQLDKILADIAEEKPLHPYNEASKSKKDLEEAWIRVGKKNKLSAHEAKSIFKVLQKKYEQEKLKPSSTWKLYQQMEEICQKEEEIKPKIEPEEATPMDEESFVEFLEVREDDEDYEGDSDNQDKSLKSNSSTGSPEKEAPAHSVEAKPEQKLLNTQMMIPQQSTQTRPDYSSAQTQSKPMSTAFTNALQKKGISMRKTTSPALRPPAPMTASQPTKGALNPRSMILSENLKRKLQSVEKREESLPAKRSNASVNNSTQVSTTTTTTTIPTLPSVEIKQEVVDEVEASLANATGEPINVITIPSNPQTVSTDLSNGITTIKTNGFNTLDFQKDIIFDNSTKPSTTAGEIINIGNFENQLPPTFFKNLCNSQRHEALGLYVANVMNRVSSRAAAKLELSILKSIIEAQSEELEKL